MRTTLCMMLVGVALTAALAKNDSNGKASSASVPDGEQAYKTNCTRCHSAPPAMSERQATVVLRHMRVKANLPARDAEAVLQYLLQSDRSN